MVLGDERIAARTKLADMANDHAQSIAFEPIAAVVPEYPDAEQVKVKKSARLAFLSWALVPLCAVLAITLMWPTSSVSGDMNRRLLWVWLDDREVHAVPEEWRFHLERRWYKATAPTQGHGKQYSLAWSPNSVVLSLSRPRLKALVECGELFCFFRLKPIQGGRDSWHEQVPVRASLKRWQAVMDRAIAFQRAQLPHE